MDMFDKSLVTTLVKMTHVLGTYHGPYLRFYGAQAKNMYTDEEEPLTRARMSMCRVCFYHVGQDSISKSPGICGEALACMSFECIRFQVDVIAGDGNKACYLATPKAGGCPTYEVSLLQFWINCMIHTATKARIKNYGKAPDVRVKHFISCTYKDLEFLAKHLRGITTNTYTHELAKKTENVGDCCMMSVCAWGHARLESEEDINDFGDQDHMDFVGEFSCSVNETCLSCDHNIFMVAPAGTDAHNPLLIHLKPSDMEWKEKRSYMHPAKKQQREEIRKDMEGYSKVE
jgi:hypothetical protein